MQSHMDILGAQHKHKQQSVLNDVIETCTNLHSVWAVPRAHCKSKALSSGKDILYFLLFNTLAYILKILINGHIL